MKKLISLFLIIVMCYCSTAPSVLSAANEGILPFSDVNTSAWYFDEVKEVYEEGIMEGKSSNKFDPSANMIRAEFVTVLCRLSGEDYKGKGNALTFADTNVNEWYADYVAWGVEAEMVKGLPGNKFAPSQAVSRQEMAVFIDRFISYMNIELKENAKIDSFSDIGKVASFAKDAVDTMRKSGIITGDENGYFNPTDSASRAEVATVITRILPLLDGVKISPDPIVPEITGEFVLHEEEKSPLPYYVYVPENYDTNNRYPLVIFSRENGRIGIDSVETIFSHKDSPAYKSIVIVPNTKNSNENNKVDELIQYINSCYSTDNERVYMVAVNDHSTYDTWKMLLEEPDILSAVVFVHGVSATLGTNIEDGQIVLLDDAAYGILPNNLKDLPIGIVHCLDDNRPLGIYLDTKYGKQLYDALQYSGFENVYLKEVNGYPDVYNNFINENDMSQLEWLFAQRRVTE